MRQRGGMGRASVPGPSMAAERGGAGRGVAHRCGPAGAVRSGKVRRGRRGGREGGAGGPAVSASIGHTACIRRPRRSCPSPPCATVGPEEAGAARNSEQDRALTIEPARPRRGKGGGVEGGGVPPPRLRGAGSHAGDARPSARRAHPLDRNGLYVSAMVWSGPGLVTAAALYGPGTGSGSAGHGESRYIGGDGSYSAG